MRSMVKTQTKYVCQNCGYITLRWLGKCPECESWNTMAEETIHIDKRKPAKSSVVPTDTALAKLENIEIDNEIRLKTNIDELDRVLGGGIVSGSAILLGGDPGIGKSTLMIQLCSRLDNKSILYVSGEESARQIKLRCERLGFKKQDFYILNETNLDVINSVIDKIGPDLIIIDSIQTIYRPEIESSPGTVTQLRESAAGLINISKSTSIPVVMIGHITKEGAIAGPKVLEHMVDTVLQFEGEKTHLFRILRAVKNRFGSTNEIAIFEMTGEGLEEIANPSEIFISDRNIAKSGSAFSASIEGTRPILVEVQALVTGSPYSIPQRTETGFGFKRLAILIAVIEKRFGVHLNRHDVFLNIAGGIKIDEPSIDLAAACSIYSSFIDQAIEPGTIVLGELGLGGEVRNISYAEKRIQEAAKLGFKRVILPSANFKKLKLNGNIELIPAETIQDAFKKIFKI